MSWALGLILVIALATLVPWLIAELAARPDRRWLKRLRGIERARLDWQARCIREQCFWRREDVQ